MTLGHFRDGHPRITLTLPGVGGSLEIEFVIDTGFQGDLAVPPEVARLLGGSLSGFRRRTLADGSPVICPFYEISLDWPVEGRWTEVLVLDGQPLLGTSLLEEHLLQIEITEGGEVLVDPL